MKNVFITIAGIYIILLGLLLAGMTGASLFFLDAGTASLPMNYNPSFLVIAYLPLTIWLLSTGISLLLRKNWARYSLGIMSFFALFMGLVISLTFLLFPLTIKISLFLRIISFALILFVFILVPLFFLIFFSKKTVKELFKSRDRHLTGAQKPFGIILVTIITFLSGIFSFLCALFPNYQKLPILGNLFLADTGLKIYFYILAILNVYIAIGLIRLKKSAWILCIVYNIVSIIMGIVNLFIISEEMILKITPLMSDVPREMLLVYYRIYGILGLLILIAVVSYVISRKKLFMPAVKPGLPVNK
jgi:hypothetical protein